MKVVHLLPALEEGGVESVVINLNRMVVRAGWESVVVSRGGRLAAQIAADGGRALTLDLKGKNPLTYLPRAYALRRLLRREKPDLVCVHSRVPAWLFVWANRALDLKWISYAHGANSVSRYSAVLTRGDRIIVPSEFLGDYLTAHYEFPRERLRVVPNAVDTERFAPNAAENAAVLALRQCWTRKSGGRVSLAVGRLTPIKGYDALIRELAADGDASRALVIVGGADRKKTAYADELKALAASLGVADRVIFAGPRSDIPTCLAAADEVVSGNVAKPESFGLSIAEAYAMNRPVRVLRRFGGVGEIMDTVEGAHAPTARDAVLAHYGFDIISQQTLGVYKELLK